MTICIIIHLFDYSHVYACIICNANNINKFSEGNIFHNIVYSNCMYYIYISINFFASIFNIYLFLYIFILVVFVYSYILIEKAYFLHRKRFFFLYWMWAINILQVERKGSCESATDKLNLIYYSRNPENIYIPCNKIFTYKFIIWISRIFKPLMLYIIK